MLAGDAAKTSQRRQTAAVLVCAASLRLLVLAGVLLRYSQGWFFQRGVEMGLLARSLLGGLGLSSPFGGSTGPTAFIAPGYPLLIAAVFRLFGEETRLSAAAIMSGQAVLGVLTVWLLMHIARSLFGQRTALVAGLLWSCSFPLLWIPTIFWDTSLSICLGMGLLALVLRLREHVSPGMWLFLGAYCAITALINPALLPVLAAFLLWLAWQARSGSRSHVLLAALSFGIVFAPWPLRNARVFHAFIPLRTTIGFELWMGNHEGASGYLEQRLFPMYNQVELAEYRRMGEIGYTAHKSALAWQYMESHPARFLSLAGIRFLRFWTGTGTKGGSPFFALHACLTSAFGLAGLWLLRRQHSNALATLFAAPLLLFPLPYYCTHAEFRYRLVLDPMLTLLASYFVVEARSAVTRPSALEIRAVLATSSRLV